MATPIISTLRRNQGYILAVMGVVLIVTWVIGPAAMDFFGGGSQGRQPKALPSMQWNKAGTTQFLSDGDLMHLRQEHMAVLDFVGRIVKRTLDKDRTPQAPGLNVKGDPSRHSLGLPMDTSEATVVNIMLFAERGREMGVRIDKAAMVNYLVRLSDYDMLEGDFREVAQETVKDAIEKGQVISVDSLFTALRKELVAQQTRYLLFSSVENVSTGELWDLHKQLNMRYKIEAYPFDVERLKASFKAADAKPEDLMALFNKGKDQVPNPDSPEPGFRVPHRIAFGYFTVDFEIFLAQAKKNVTDKQALERYEKGIAQGDYRKPKPLTEKPKEPAPGETTPDETKPGEDKPAGDEKKPGEPDKKEEPGEPKSEEKPAEKPSVKGTEPVDEKPAEKPAAEKPVAVVCDDEQDKAAKPGEEKKPEESKPAAKDKSTEPPKEGDEKTEPAKKDGEKTEPAKTPEAAPGETPEAAAEKTDDSAKTEKKEEAEEIVHKSFPEVRDQILTELAQPEAVLLRDAAVEKAVEELQTYSAKLKQFEESKKDKESGVEDPGPFRPDAFAKKYGFAHGKTKLVDQHQVDTTVLGQDAIRTGTQGSYRFSEFAFDGNVSLFDPEVASAFGETKYIFWRTDDQPEQNAELEKDGKFSPALKAQVEDAWLKQKAFEAAKKKAEELVAKVKGSSLRDVVGKDEDAKVVQPIPFSMFTTNGMPLIYTGRAAYSQPNGIPMAGREFMEAVFALKPGESGVALDQPHNVVYAVHVLADEPSLDIRREMFLETLRRGQYTDLIAFASVEKRGEIQSLFADLDKHFSVKWNRLPNMGREEE